MSARQSQKKRKDDRSLHHHEEKDNKNGNTHPSPNPQPTVEELRRKVKGLEDEVYAEREKRRKLEQHFFDYQKRMCFREEEFFRILDRLNANRKTSIQGDSQIQNIYNQILHNFDEANQKTHLMLQEKYKKNFLFMERRIFQILKSMNSELNKSRTISIQSISAIKSQINEVLSLAKGVEEEYLKTKQSKVQLEYKLKLIREQRDMLIQENLKRKKRISELKQQIKKVKETKETKEATKLYSMETLETSKKASVQFYRLSNTSQSIRKNSNSRTTKSRNYSLHRGTGHSSTTLEPEKEQLYINTIKSLKNSLKRTQEKNQQLGSLVTRIETSHKGINQDFQQCVKTKEGPDKAFIDSQKLFKTITILRKRLAMVEPPAVACGWDHDIEGFLQKN